MTISKSEYLRRLRQAPIEQLLAGKTLPDGTSGEEAARALRETAEHMFGDEEGDDDAEGA